MFLRNYVPRVVLVAAARQTGAHPPGGSVVGVAGSWQEVGVRGSPGGGDHGCWIPIAKHHEELDCCLSLGLPSATSFEQ